MLTKNDIVYSGQQTDRVIIAIAIGIEGEVLVALPTFVDFYEFLLENTEVVCLAQDCTIINYLKDGEVLETLSVDAFLGSILASNPDIIEIVRRNPDNTLPEITDELRTRMAVGPGWQYNSTGFITPPGWTLPPLPTKEDEEKLRERLDNQGA
jgi:hypothetical protein